MSLPSLRRCLLFVPGDRPERYAKALASGADMVCIDLEDAVALDSKASARADALTFCGGDEVGCVGLRINALSSDAGQADLDALKSARRLPAFLMLAKCESADQLHAVEHALGERCPALVALVETAIGLRDIDLIAAAGGPLAMLMLGGFDLCIELRARFGWDALLYARGRLVAAAAAAGLDALDVPFIDIKDTAGLEAETTRVLALGFTSKAAIHPNQVSTIESAFLPSPIEITQAQRVVAAATAGVKGAIALDGKLIDRPVLVAAQRVLALVESLHISNPATPSHRPNPNP